MVAIKTVRDNNENIYTKKIPRLLIAKMDNVLLLADYL